MGHANEILVPIAATPAKWLAPGQTQQGDIFSLRMETELAWREGTLWADWIPDPKKPSWRVHPSLRDTGGQYQHYAYTRSGSPPSIGWAAVAYSLGHYFECWRVHSG